MSGRPPAASDPRMFVVHALADPTRWTVVRELARRGRLALDDMAELVDVTRSTLKYHVHLLVEAGVVGVDDEGPEPLYLLLDRALQALLDDLAELAG